MTDDTRDPLRAAFQDYKRAPRDRVPKEPRPIDSNADLEELDGTSVELVTYEADAEGVTRHAEDITITRPIYPKESS